MIFSHAVYCPIPNKDFTILLSKYEKVNGYPYKVHALPQQLYWCKDFF